MATPNPPPKPAGKRSYISSSGNVLETPPFSARLSRLGDDMYNFLGLYFVSLFSLDPYTAAQGSQFVSIPTASFARPLASTMSSPWH